MDNRMAVLQGECVLEEEELIFTLLTAPVT